jgi:hypothetical protein
VNVHAPCLTANSPAGATISIGGGRITRENAAPAERRRGAVDEFAILARVRTTVSSKENPMRPLPLLAVVLTAAALAAPWPAHAKRGDRSFGGGAVEPAHPTGFSTAEKQVIRDYFAVPENRRAVGETGKPLPPGIQKKVARAGLPPGIAKHYLPADLEARLPPHPGAERLILGADVLLVELGTGLVFDILHDALSAP